MSVKKRTVSFVFLVVMLSLSIAAAVSPFAWIKQIFGEGITGFVVGSGSGYVSPRTSGGSSGADSAGNVEVVKIIGSGSGYVAPKTSGSGAGGEISIVSGGELSFSLRSSKIIALGGGENYKITLLSVGEGILLLGITLPDGQYKILKGESAKEYEVGGLKIKIKSIIYSSTNRGSSRVVLEAQAVGGGGGAGANELKNMCSLIDADVNKAVSKLDRSLLVTGEFKKIRTDNFVLVTDGEKVKLLKLQSIEDSSSADSEDDLVKFKDVITGENYEVNIESEGKGIVYIFGKEFIVYYYGSTVVASDERYIEIDYPGTSGPDRFSFESCLKDKGIGVSGSGSTEVGAGAGVITLTSEESVRVVVVGDAKYRVELVSASDTSANIQVVGSNGKSESKEMGENEARVFFELVNIKLLNADENNLKLKVVLSINKAISTQPGKAICENGCIMSNKCVPYGIRSDEGYCELSGLVGRQKASGAICQNNYECIDNVCTAGACMDVNKLIEENNNLRGMFYKLWCKVNNLFDDGSYNLCLAKYLDGSQEREYKFVINKDFGELRFNVDSLSTEPVEEIAVIMPNGYVEGEAVTYSKRENSDLGAAIVLDYDHEIAAEEFSLIKNKLRSEGISYRIDKLGILVFTDGDATGTIWYSDDKLVFIVIENVKEAGEDADSLIEAYMKKFPSSLERNSDKDEDGIELKLVSIMNQSSGYKNDVVEFKDVENGEIYSATMKNEGQGIVYIGGVAYGISYGGSAVVAEDERRVFINGVYLRLDDVFKVSNGKVTK